MKTRLEIPDVTLRRAEAAAEALGISLGDFVARAVEEKVAKEGRRQGKRWLECAGELEHLHEETMRIPRLIEAEFSVIVAESSVIELGAGSDADLADGRPGVEAFR